MQLPEASGARDDACEAHDADESQSSGEADFGDVLALGKVSENALVTISKGSLLMP